MSYRHGVYIQERDTSLVTPATAEASLPVVVGTAPVHNLPENATVPVNVPKLISTMSEFVATFGDLGEDDDEEDFTLYQAAKIYIGRYGIAPMVCINVFNPTTHKTDSTPDVSKVTATDIIGGSTSGRTGLALVDDVYPRFRLTPGLVLAPKFSATPSVALAIAAACKDICGHFRAQGIIDVPSSVTTYSGVPSWLNTNNLTSPYLCAFFGSLTYAGVVEPGSIHLAGCIGSRDAANGDIPFYSPSNYTIMAEGLVHNGNEVFLTPVEAAYLNGNGVVTALNMIGGLKCWGDQTCCYPGVTDVKDSSLPIRRMFNWLANTLVLTSWQYVSTPLRRRLVETVQDTFNCWLLGLTAKECILGGRVTFESADNSTTDLMDGKVTWHVYVTPPQAARELTFTLEYDPDYLSTLFE